MVICSACSRSVEGNYEFRSDGSAICQPCHDAQALAAAQRVAAKVGPRSLARFGGIDHDREMVHFTHDGKMVASARVWLRLGAIFFACMLAVGLLVLAVE